MAEDDPQSADFREFAHQLVLRFERAMGDLIAEMREERLEASEELRTAQAENRAYFERLDRKADEQIAESRAQRQALLHILDRLDNGGTAPAT